MAHEARQYSRQSIASGMGLRAVASGVPPPAVAADSGAQKVHLFSLPGPSESDAPRDSGAESGQQRQAQPGAVVYPVPSRGASLDEGFDRFWAIFPRKQKKKDARKAWAELRPDAALVRTILAAIAWQRNQPAWVKDGGQYCPLPASWIRGERWEDEPFQAPDDTELFRREMEKFRPRGSE